MRNRLISLFSALTVAGSLFGQAGDVGLPTSAPTGRRPGFPSHVAVEAVGWNVGVTYQYDGAGNIRKVGTDSHVYDGAGRLVQSDMAGFRQEYTYDGFGNRLTCSASGTDCQYGYAVNQSGNRNQLANVTYSPAGAVTAIGGEAIVYDAAKMPVRKSVGAVAEEYVYTAGDERIAVYDTVNNWRWTLRDTSGKVLREFTSQNGANGALGAGSWTWSRDYVYRDGTLAASRQIEPGNTTPTTYHYHLDHLGTPRRITNDFDAIVGVHDYYAFGPETSGGTNEPSPTRLKFTGHERELHTAFSGLLELDYMHARYYAGAVGRFLSVDPFLDLTRATRNPQNWNRYAYVRNNPINSVDPDGRDDVNIGEDFKVTPGNGPCQGSATDCRNLAMLENGLAVGMAAPLAIAVGVYAGPVAAELGMVAAIRFPALYNAAIQWLESETFSPSSIRFTQDSIKSTFKAGGAVDDMIAGLKNGSIKPKDVQPIRLFKQDGKIYTLDNRRLYAFQQAGIKKIRAVWATDEELAKELPKKFTTANGGVSVRIR